MMRCGIKRKKEKGCERGEEQKRMEWRKGKEHRRGGGLADNGAGDVSVRRGGDRNEEKWNNTICRTVER